MNICLFIALGQAASVSMVLRTAGKTDDVKSTVALEDSPDSRGCGVSHESHSIAVKKVNISGQNINLKEKFTRCNGQNKFLCEVCSKEDCKKCNNCL